MSQATYCFSSRFTPGDLFEYHVGLFEDISVTVGRLTVLGGCPAPDRVRREYEEFVAEIPRFQQQLRCVPGELAPPVWTTSPDFRFDDHFRVVDLAGRGSIRDAQAVADELQSEPWDFTRPLWRYAYMPGLRDGRAATAFMFHHSFSDGAALVELFSRLTARRVTGRSEPMPLGITTGPEPQGLVLETLGHYGREFRAACGLLRKTLAARISAEHGQERGGPAASTAQTQAPARLHLPTRPARVHRRLGVIVAPRLAESPIW